MKCTYFFWALIVWLGLSAGTDSILTVEPVALDENIDSMPMWHPTFAVDLASFDEQHEREKKQTVEHADNYAYHKPFAPVQR